jgi:hypothetical protein
MNFKDVPGQSQLTLDQQPGRRRKHITARLMFKVVNNMAPPRFSSMFQNCDRIYISTVINFEVLICLSSCRIQIPSVAEDVSVIQWG